jgi:hypothetical protein
MQLVVLYAVVTIHELGHLLGGWLVGMRFQQLTVGPLTLRRTRRGLQLHLNPGRSWYGGGSLSVPTATGALRYREAVMAGAGPLASLVLGVIAVGVLLRSTLSDRPLAASALAVVWLALVVTVWSLASFFGNALPARVGGTLTDGAKFLALVRGGEWAERACALATLSAWSLAGHRPGEWDAAVVRRLIHLSDGDRDDVQVPLLAYYWALDRGEVAHARHSLEQAIVIGAHASGPLRVQVALEAAYFEGRHGGHAAQARRWLAIAQETPSRGERHRQLRAEAAAWLAEGQQARVHQCALAGLGSLREALDDGLARAEGDWLGEIADPVTVERLICAS